MVAKRAQNDPKMAPPKDPTSIKNRVHKMFKQMIDFKRAILRFGGLPGVMRRPWGNLQGGERPYRLVEDTKSKKYTKRKMFINGLKILTELNGCTGPSSLLR